MPTVRSAAIAALLAVSAGAQVPCWETSFGNNLTLGDDAYSIALPLGFTFTFNGIAYTDVVVCSNGYLWLGPAAPAGLVPDYSPTEAKLSSEGPRIAPLWLDFNPAASGSGNVWFNTFPANGSTPARAVATWDHVFEYQRTVPLSMQLTMTSTGDVYVHFDSNMAVVQGGFGSNNHVIGTSSGTSVVNPVNFSALPIVTATDPTLYQTIARGVFPLVGKDLQFAANGAGGFTVTERVNCGAGAFLTYGSGCPRGMSTYEIWNAAGGFDLANQSLHFISTGAGGYAVIAGPGFDTSYSSPVAMGDDTLVLGQALGFGFPYAGGSHAAVDLSSNGMVYMSGGSHNAVNGYPTAATLLGDARPIIAFLWQDLDLSTGGQAYWDVSPGVAMFSIVGAPYWQLGGSNDAQLKLFASGDIVMSWRTAASTAGGPCMVGISEGNNAPDFGPTDWSASLPLFISAAGTLPLTLAALPGSRPGLGLTFTMQLSNIPPATGLGAMILSFTRTNLDLTFLGMAGCHDYVGLDSTFVLVIGGPTVNFGFGIPNATSYLGLRVYAQGGTFSSGFNSLGVIASNGGELHIGL